MERRSPRLRSPPYYEEEEKEEEEEEKDNNDNNNNKKKVSDVNQLYYKNACSHYCGLVEPINRFGYQELRITGKTN